MVLYSIETLARKLGTDVDSLPHYIFEHTANGADIDWDENGFTIGFHDVISGFDVVREFQFPANLSEVLAWINGGFDNEVEAYRSEVNDQIDLYYYASVCGGAK